MRDYSHISKYEKILDEHGEKLEELDAILTWMKDHEGEYRTLMDWYESDERNEDLHDDEEGLIPEGLKRGVFSEDGIWNFSVEHDRLAIEMMEQGLSMIKGN